MACKHTAEVLSSVLSGKGYEVPHRESTQLDKLHPGMNFNAVACEFNVMNKKHCFNQKKKIKYAGNVCDATLKSSKNVQYLMKLWKRQESS